MTTTDAVLVTAIVTLAAMLIILTLAYLVHVWRQDRLSRTLYADPIADPTPPTVAPIGDDGPLLVTFARGACFVGMPMVTIRSADAPGVIRLDGRPVDLAKHYPTGDPRDWVDVPGVPSLEIRSPSIGTVEIRRTARTP